MKSRRMRWRGMLHVWERGEAQEWFSWGNLREISHMEDPEIGRIILK